jgi:cell fate (sporulation/competence/biofilm development) regulator YlbF (YheA/YmcA/DUF963 family)
MRAGTDRPQVRRPPALIGVLLVLLALVGCGMSQREKAIRTTFAAVNVAREGFVVFDAKRQQQIVAEAKSLDEGKAALATYRQDRERVFALFEGVYHALAAAVLASDSKSMANMLDVATELGQAIKDLEQAAP